MSILSAFEALSLIPFCSEEIKEDFLQNLPSDISKESFVKGDQLTLRTSLSSFSCENFADAIDVVAF